MLRRELTGQLAPPLELVEQPAHRFPGAQVEAGRFPDGRRLEPVRPAEHRPREDAHRLDRRRGGPDVVESRQRLASQSNDTLLDVRANSQATEPALEIVSRGPRKARVRRAEEAEQVTAALAPPQEAKRREERVPEGRLPKPSPPLDGVRDSRRREDRLEGRA